MKDIFDFKRFGKYFVSDFRNCSANFGLSLITLPLMIYVVCYLISISFGLIENHEWSGLNLGIGSRAALFACIMFCIIVTMPVKCYGMITERQSGSLFITLPVSRLEKFLSMIILTAIAAPAIGAGLFLCLDALVCALDKTCGTSLINGMTNLISNIAAASVEIETELNAADIPAEFVEFFKKFTNLWLYVDDVIGFSLMFLLGAICFRKGKTVKTFISIVALSIAASIIMTPIMMSWGKEFMTDLTDHEVFLRLSDTFIFRHPGLTDTINDTIFNAAMLTGIWFRIKTLKH